MVEVVWGAVVIETEQLELGTRKYSVPYTKHHLVHKCWRLHWRYRHRISVLVRSYDGEVAEVQTIVAYSKFATEECFQNFEFYRQQFQSRLGLRTGFPTIFVPCEETHGYWRFTNFKVACSQTTARPPGDFEHLRQLRPLRLWLRFWGWFSLSVFMEIPGADCDVETSLTSMTIPTRNRQEANRHFGMPMLVIWF